jgi:hypothetical protein
MRRAQTAAIAEATLLQIDTEASDAVTSTKSRARIFSGHEMVREPSGCPSYSAGLIFSFRDCSDLFVSRET